MKMLGDIRVQTHQKYRTLYKEFRNLVVKESHELFFICSSLGYKRKKRSPLGRSGDPRFWSSTISPEEYSSYYAMIIESSEMDFDSIEDDSKVIAIIEEYANAGMEILLDEILSDYVIEQDNDIRLDPSCKGEIAKITLAFLYEQTS